METEIFKIGLSITRIYGVNCLGRTCRGDARKVFFEEKGLAQHFRIKHARVVFDNVKQVREAWRLFRYLHGEETKEHSRRLSAERQQVSVFYCLVKFAVHLALEYS